MFAAATSFFARTNISSNYNIGQSSSSSPYVGFGSTGSRSSTPGPAGTSTSSGVPGASSASPALPPPPPAPPFHVGLWKVQPAAHKVTHKRVSVWSYDKRDADRVGAGARERVLEALKNEASALGRLRHPCILEMVEPLEETRYELVFATEPLLSSLNLAIPASGHSSISVELDEVEIQKGILQLCKGLDFLHTSARRIHSNLNPDSVLINASGDWKIGGLGHTMLLSGSDGASDRWQSPIYDSLVPGHIQRSFDYLAPEYVLDEQLITASDMYSLGCLIYAVHNKGSPPYQNYNSASSLRENVGKTMPRLDGADSDLRDLLSSLITRHSHSRPTPTGLTSHTFFSSLPISTLNFLDRSNFASKSREEKVNFMKGLIGVLDRFSEGLKTRKILPSLVEEMKDANLLPYILPNIFAISRSLSTTQFASLVLPSLKPLFSVKEPPQSMITLLDNLNLLQSKTDKAVFREHVLPLVYNALESEHAVVQECALRAVPNLCETIDYAEVQGVLFPRVALVFSKTRILSVKVTSLQTFLAMVKTLDQSSLTQKLVPLLSKIRTKEPGVMLATLAVQEAMGLKVDREAVATLVLPQLWAMSTGPLLNLDQFQRFMTVIKKLGERVEREHLQHLRDSQRLEDRSAVPVGHSNGLNTEETDFASLVGNVRQKNVEANPLGAIGSTTAWEEDMWDSLLNDSANVQSPSPISNVLQTRISPSSMFPRTLPPSISNIKSGPSIGATLTPVTPTFSTLKPPPISQPLQPLSTDASSSLRQPVRPSSFAQPNPLAASAGFQTNLQLSKPNYNISLPPATSLSPIMSTLPIMTPVMPVNASVPSINSILLPSASSQPRNDIGGKKPTRGDLLDFDPFK